MSRETEPCGCKHDGLHWLHRCDYHTQADAEGTAAFFERRSMRPESGWLIIKTDAGDASDLL